MINLSNIGRIFYGIAISGLGILSIYYMDFPYMLIPSKHSWIPGLAIFAFISGALLIFSGIIIVFIKRARLVTLWLGAVLLLVFCFYFIPYQLIISTKSMHFWDWENAAKELALCSGAFVVAGCLKDRNTGLIARSLGALVPIGSILFAAAMISFGVDHFLYAKEAAGYVPSWIPNHIFWIYFAGVPLIGSGLAIILKIKVRIIATLLGTMIFIWFIILHIPYVISSSLADRPGEAASALIALGYSGTAFVIAGTAGKKTSY